MVVAISKMFICSKIAGKSFGDGSQDICKDKESNLGPVAGLSGWNYPEAFFNLNVMKATRWTNWINYRLFTLSHSVFCFVLFWSPPRSFFHLNNLRKVQKRCSYSIFSSQAIILDFFDWNIGLCYVRVFRLLWATVASFVDSSNEAINYKYNCNYI